MATRTIRVVSDRLENALTGMGTGRDPRAAASYALAAPLSRHDLTAAWRGSGILRKIVSIPAHDMVREWRVWKAEPDQITAIEAEETRLGLRRKVRDLEVLRGRGGAAAILGLPGDPSSPAPRSIGKGGLAYINVVSRWQIDFDRLVDDARDERFGEPDMYSMTLANGASVDIHPSRVVPFRADTSGAMADAVSAWTDADLFWGESVIAKVLDAVKDFDTARASFAALIHKARLTRIGIPGLMAMVSTDEGSRDVMKRLAVLASAESIHNATIYDAGEGDGGPEEKIADAVYNFAGARDVLDAYAGFVAAISDIPATRLLGRAPEGMNSSGDSQQRDWNKKIRAMQALDLQPCLDRIDDWLIQSALGSRPAEVWHEWAPLDMPDQKDVADRFLTQMQAAEKLQMMAAVPEEAFNRAVQSLLIDEGYMPGLEQALAEIPEDERFGVAPDPDGVPDEL